MTKRMRRIPQDNVTIIDTELLNWISRIGCTTVEFASKTTSLTGKGPREWCTTNSQILKATSGPVLAW